MVERPGFDVVFFFSHFSPVFIMLLLCLWFKLYFKVITWTERSIIKMVFHDMKMDSSLATFNIRTFQIHVKK